MLLLGRVRLGSDGKCNHDDAHVLSGVLVDHHIDGHRLQLFVHLYPGKVNLTDVLIDHDVQDPIEAEDK